VEQAYGIQLVFAFTPPSQSFTTAGKQGYFAGISGIFVGKEEGKKKPLRCTVSIKNQRFLRGLYGWSGGARTPDPVVNRHITP
jgi:hypothetical protein